MLCHDWPVFDTTRLYQVDGVAIAAESAGPGRHIIGEDPIATFVAALDGRVLHDIFGFGSKAEVIKK